MGFWTGIKHAINSTLGTADFKPLDKIIEGQRTLAASDSVIQVVFSENINIYTSYKEVGRFIPRVDGSVRLLFVAKRLYAGDDTFQVYLKNAESGLGISTTNIVLDKDIPEPYNVYVDISVRKNKEYIIKVSANKGIAVNSFKIGANIVDTSLVEVV